MEHHHSQKLIYTHSSDNQHPPQSIMSTAENTHQHQQLLVRQQETIRTTRGSLQQALVTEPRRAQSMPDKIPITVIGDDYDWRSNRSSPNHLQEGPVFSTTSISSLYHDHRAPTTAEVSSPTRNANADQMTRNFPNTTYPATQQSHGQHPGHHHEVSFSSSSSSSSSNDEESSSHVGDSTSNESSRSDEVISEEDSAPDEFSFNLAHLSLQQTYTTTTKKNVSRHSSAESSSVEPSNPKRIKQEENPMLCDMHHHQKFLHAKKQRRDDRKMERDAAMAAAMYYGECYMEGVGMSDAERAAKESHKWFKKWCLQDAHTSGNVVASLGDGYRVPRFNSPHGKMVQSRKAPSEKSTDTVSTGVEGIKRKKSFRSDTLSTNERKEEEDEEINRHQHDVAILNSESTTEEEHDNVENAATSPLSSVIVSRGVDIDRNSGARNPPISQNSVVGKKRQRFTSTVPSSSGNSNGNCGTESACSSTDETIPFSNLHELPNKEQRDDPQQQHQESSMSRSVTKKQPTTFESFRDERMERERRLSTYSDYYDDDAANPIPLSRQSSDKTSSSRNEADTKQRHQSEEQHSLELKCNDEDKYDAILTSVSSPLERTAKHIDNAKMELIRSLSITGGDVTSQTFLFALEQLRTLYAMTENDARYVSSPDKRLEGTWLTISRPHYAECLGANTNGEYMYSLGRMSFDMFAPGNLICSIHGIFNSIDIVQAENICFRSIPNSLKNEVKKGDTILRRYNIITSFNVEPDSPLFGSHSPNKNILKSLRGKITTYGYVLPDPNTTNRLSIWFSGGKIEPNLDQEDDMEKWKKAFGGGTLKRHFQEKARVLASKLLLGAVVPTQMEEDGSMEFTLNRPIGGHGTAYVDVLYLDDNLRIVQGNRGSIFVMTRVTS